METSDTFTFTNDFCLYQCRSLFQIVWSCVSLLFACTWVSVHPNVPARKDGSWTILGKRLGLMIMTLIAPELLVLWAARQWFAARKLSKKFKELGWGVSHGHFLLMGGFAQYQDDKLERVLRYHHLTSREEKIIGKIEEREIEDHGHSDYFAKLIATGQAAWFVIQLLARWAQHLPMTLLEVTTFAFALMDLLIYFFWWSKPQGVNCYVRIDGQGFHKSEDYSYSMQRVSSQTLSIHSFGERVHKAFDSFVESARKNMQQWELSYRRDVAAKGGILPKLQVVALIFLFPITTLFDVIFLDDGTLYRRVPDQVNSDEVVSFARIPKLEPSDKKDQYIAYGAAILFGGIHCAAWGFLFPDAIEQRLWRIACIIVTGAPMILVVVVFTASLNSRGFGWWAEFFGYTVIVFGIVGYIAARFTLIVLPFLVLRDLPQGAFKSIDWTAFIPHI
ncbi:hypothetical protein GYMLUDRAFT_154185 [Collybiopsis luxurians FD-317 M1]|nr:hypothetical protein GYMLUDRAFT_154185 [Collybiopsis luxurians FD-317 M1]